MSPDIIKKTVHSLYVTKTVGELLFEGYVDELMTLNKNFKDNLKGIVHDLDRFPDQFAWYWGVSAVLTKSTRVFDCCA